MKKLLRIEELASAYEAIPHTTKCSTSDCILLHPSTLLAIVCIGPGFIKEDHWSLLHSISSHSMKVGMPLSNDARLFIVVSPIINLFVPV